MSRPRRPYGTSHPGTIPATMIKVLAAEVSDGQRFARGKRYWSDGAVIDIEVEAGVVTAEIQGSRRAPYVVSMRVQPGRGVPARSELRLSCTCPDSSGWGAGSCKHAVAALFALSAEVTVEPDLVDRWRGQSELADDRADAADAADGADAADDLERPRSGRIAEVIDLAARRHARADSIAAAGPAETDPVTSELASVLGYSTDLPLPELPVIEPIEHPALRDPILDAVLRDALEQLDVGWLDPG